MTKLTWRYESMGYAGTIWVASVHDARDAVAGIEKGFRWELQGVRCKWLKFKTIGTLKTQRGAQRAAQRAWEQWLDAAGVVENASYIGHSGLETAK